MAAGDADPASIPPGEYTLIDCKEWLVKDKEQPLEVTILTERTPKVKIAQEHTTEVDAGPPFTGALTFLQSNTQREVTFELAWQDKHRCFTYLKCPFDQSRDYPVRLEITDADGKLVDRMSMGSFGLYYWKPPVHVKDPLTVTAKTEIPFVSGIDTLTMTLDPTEGSNANSKPATRPEGSR